MNRRKLLTALVLIPTTVVAIPRTDKNNEYHCYKLAFKEHYRGIEISYSAPELTLYSDTDERKVVVSFVLNGEERKLGCLHNGPDGFDGTFNRRLDNLRFVARSTIDQLLPESFDEIKAKKEHYYKKYLEAVTEA